ncbi:hypothetical protein ACLX1H_000780 [Fusarium chlamydosporum]
MLTSHKLPENPTFISDFIVIIAFGIVQILAASGLSALLAAILYLSRINHILKQTPNEIKQLTSLVGGYIVLQLLARGTPPKSVRIVDIRGTERDDMRSGLATQVDFVRADITSGVSAGKAFTKPWDHSIAHLPITVFHTVAVIVPSARSEYLYKFPEVVNVQGTRNVLAASRAVGADVFSATSSASIGIQPHEEYFGNYAASKAAAERLVYGENDASFRTGCIRPGNGVYDNPTDNPVGSLLSQRFHPTWVPHIVQSFVHGANVAVAHLYHEPVLAKGECPQAGRPFVITDPGPPIMFGDLYTDVRVLSVHRFRIVTVPPIIMLLLSVLVEWYILLSYRFPSLKKLLPEVKGDIKKLQPGLFSTCTHLVAFDNEARKSVRDGGLGYKGFVTTLEGVVMEIWGWNQEHSRQSDGSTRKTYTTSVSLAEKLQEFGSAVPL